MQALKCSRVGMQSFDVAELKVTNGLYHAHVSK